MRLALILLLGAFVLGVILSALSSVVGLLFWGAVVVGIVAGVVALLRHPAEDRLNRDLSHREHKKLQKKVDRALNELEEKVGKQ